jgi:hypothetical protein
MKRVLTPLAVAAVLAVPALMIVGCDDATTSTAKADTVELCTGCGQVKGGETCCQPDAEKCAACDLAQGSPGCCKMPEGAEKVELCTACGQFAGTEKCCDPDAEKCSACNLAKASPGCCKIPAK